MVSKRTSQSECEQIGAIGRNATGCFAEMTNIYIYIEYNQDGKLEEGIGDSLWPKNKLEVKGKVYKTVVRPTMMHGAETWAVKEAQ